ncbi:Na+/H+ antiporter subunit G [Novosphingopyxis baekryungensis]|uniref:Na+/H+ antiporter subunit G n=1 Tax=Novosphingopyxis baekryungensis TaxID=279369 RepID=UPI000412C8C1|nr:Na+/H+ antiporter subunit G [Novosphingopyxis baekryungensis]
MMELGLIAEIATSAMIVLGSLLALIGSWGMVRLPTLMERLHGPAKATTLGLGALLVGSVLYYQFYKGQWSAHELLISLFLFITAPIAANMIAKVHLHRLRQDRAKAGPAGTPPAPSEQSDWSTFEAPHSDTPVATSQE